jgi:hypothetical protein
VAGITVTPSGLAAFEPILARNLFGATPIEQTSSSSPSTFSRIFAASSGGSPKRAVAPPTSRKASSSEMGST